VRNNLILIHKVSARLADEVNRSGGSIKGTGNHDLRGGFDARQRSPAQQFRAWSRNLGTLFASTAFYRIVSLVEDVDGEVAR